MGQNSSLAAEIPLTTFAGFCSYMDPVSIPAGASPDCSDVVFQPGGFGSRPCLQRFFATPLGNVTTTYTKSWVDPIGVKRNITLDSSGNLWLQNVTANTTPTVILTTTPGTYAKSCTANGREYLAFSDGLHGTDIPYQLTALPNGTIQIDRLTQDGPGASPTVTSIPYPSVALQNTGGSAPTFTISGVYPDQNVGGVWTALNIYYSAGTPSTSPVGSSVTITGLGGGFAVFNGTYTVIANPGPGGAITVGTYYVGSQSGSASGTLTVNIAGTSLVRTANVVTAQTAAAHMLQPGYRVQIAGVAAGNIGTSISSIVINNESNPGVATVTTSTAHGLVPGQDTNVSITGVQPATVGTSISSIVRAAQVVTVVMSASTGLAPGAIVTISGVTPVTFNGIWQVLNVTTTTNAGDTFTYGQVDVDASGSGGSTAVNWPIPNTPVPTFFNVIAAPTATTFQVAIDYADGSWASGLVSYAWDGQFYVQTVPSSTTFTYQQYGPNDTAVYASGQTATPYGQAAPGLHQMQVFFIDRQGGVTAPSPPVKFIANGGQYLSVTNIPLGPSPYIVARAVAFTGAMGAFFYYIPAPPQENGQLVGTATQINDNTTTSAIFDFGDPTLELATSISTQGNNLANQIVLDGALGFGYYGTRLFTYGQRNVIDNLLNMGFDGGYFGINATSIQSGSSYTIEFVGTTNFVAIGAASNTVGLTFTATGTGTGTGVVASNPVLPTGWSGGGSGSLVAGHYGGGWRTSSTALTQSMYEDYSGAPIANANDVYSFRAWLSGAGTATATISSASTSFSSTVTLTAAGAGFLQGNFSLAMPNTIPSDLILGITGTSSVVVDEMNIVFAKSPYLTGMFGSYTNNPEGFDGVSGPIGPVNDTHQVLDVFILRDNFYMLTRDPQGRLHQTSQGLTEPADWVVTQIGSSCGTTSTFALTVSQADDATGTGAPAWVSWYSVNGYMIFGGDEPEKISQEIQRPQGLTFPGAPPDLTAINPNALTTVWSLNDPENKLIYLGIPTGAATAPNVIYVLTYTGLDSAAAIVGNPPIHKSLSGKLVATDLGRKWSPYQLPMNGAALLYQTNGELAPAFFGGNGVTPNTSTVQAFGNLYTLNPQLYTDDDYGQMFPYYTTYSFPDRDTEQQMQLGGGMKVIQYGRTLMTGVGYGTISFAYNTLANIWPIAMSGYPLSLNPLADLEFGGGQCTGMRFFFTFSVSPNAAGSTASPSTDVSMSVSTLVPALSKNIVGDRGTYP